MRRYVLLAALAALVSQAIPALATNTPINPQTCQIPGACIDINTATGQLPGITFNFQTGAVAAIPAGTGGYTLVPRSVTIDTLTGSNFGTLTCSVSAVLALENCGTSTTCAAPVVIGSITLASATNSTAVPGAITTANTLVPAGSYLAWTFSSGTCTVANLQGTAVGH